jgi:glycosyltransferase involved in cell wall biosynthesis
VIGEDCSSDGTREIVRGYQEQYPDRVKVITAEQNVGMHRNALRVQNASQGRYLAFCEGDDYWHDPNKLQTEVGFLATNPDYGMTHCNYHVYEVPEQRFRHNAISSRTDLQDHEAYLELLLRRRRILTLTVCVRRDLLNTVVREHSECTDTKWPMADTQRWLEISRLARVKYFPQSMATHNYLPESASQSRDLARAFRFTEKAGELILHYLAKYPISGDRDRFIRKRVCLEVLAMAHAAKNRGKVEFWIEQLRAIPTRLPVDAHLYFLATRGVWGELFATPAIQTLSACRIAREQLTRFYRRQITESA